MSYHLPRTSTSLANQSTYSAPPVCRLSSDTKGSPHPQLYGQSAGKRGETKLFLTDTRQFPSFHPFPIFLEHHPVAHDDLCRSILKKPCKCKGTAQIKPKASGYRSSGVDAAFWVKSLPSSCRRRESGWCRFGRGRWLHDIVFCPGCDFMHTEHFVA